MRQNADLNGLPSAFRAIAYLKAFLLWQKGRTKPNGKFDKIPYYANGKRRSGLHGAPKDLEQLVTLPEAMKALERRPDLAGVGIALRSELSVVAVDIDHCLVDGKLKPEFAPLVSESYSEVSPSGKGLRILLTGDILHDYKNHQAGFELFHNKGFVTLTGNQWPSSPETINSLLAAPLIQQAIQHYGTSKSPSPETPHRGVDTTGAFLREIDRQRALDEFKEQDLKLLEAALEVLSEERFENYHQWTEVGHAIKSIEPIFPEKALELWHDFSAKSGLYDPTFAESQWATFNPTQITYRSIFYMADQVSRTWRKSHGSLADNGSVWTPITMKLSVPKTTDWLVDGVISNGLAVYSGHPGVGKTSAILPLALITAGYEFPDSNLSASYPRNVIFVTEATEQVEQKLYAYCRHFGWDPDGLCKRIMVIPARRAEGKDLATLAPIAEAMKVTHSCPAGEVSLPPFIIFDTQNSCFALKNENDNSEVGELMGAFREYVIQNLKAPVALICHMPKGAGKKAEQGDARGASAFKGDAELTANFIKDDGGNHFMVLDKVRYTWEFNEIGFKNEKVNYQAANMYGVEVDVTVDISLPFRSSAKSRAELAADLKAFKKSNATEEAVEAFHEQMFRSGVTVITQLGRGSRGYPSEVRGMPMVCVPAIELREKCKCAPEDVRKLLETKYGWVKDRSRGWLMLKREIQRSIEELDDLI